MESATSKLDESRPMPIVSLGRLSVDSIKKTKFTDLLTQSSKHFVTTTNNNSNLLVPGANKDDDEEEILPTEKPNVAIKDSRPQTSMGSSQSSGKTIPVSSTSLQQQIASAVLAKQSQIIKQSKNLHLNGDLLFIKTPSKEIVVHQKIYQHFGKDCYEKIGKNQTLIYGDAKTSNGKLSDVKDIVQFLKQSQNYKHVDKIEKLAEGGEAIVFKINYVGYDEVVLKVPKTKFQTQEGFEDLINETHLIKSIYNEKYVVEIKEEIIEVDIKTKELLRYCVIVERAKHSLYDLYSIKMKDSQLTKTGLWYNKEQASTHLENFSVTKFLYYFYETLQGLNYLHENGIIYSDMKPQNLLVMRNQNVKFGDFGISQLIKPTKNAYKMKGISPEWSMPEIRDLYNSVQKTDPQKMWNFSFTSDQLKYNDIYGVALSFTTEIVNLINEKTQVTAEEQTYLRFFEEICHKLALERSIKLSKALELIDDFFKLNTSFFIYLTEQLYHEKKYQGAFEIGNKIKEQINSDKNLKEVKKIPLFLRNYQMQSNFKLYQGLYQEAINIALDQLALIKQYLPIVKQEDIRNEILNMELENLLLQSQCYINTSNQTQAYEIAKKTVSMYESNPAQYKNYKLSILELKGSQCLHQNKAAEALQYYMLYDKEINNNPLLKSNQSRIYSYQNLGKVFYKLQHSDEALKYFLLAKDCIEAEHGSDHPMTLDCLKNIGSIFLSQGNHQKSKEQFEKALVICQNIFGEQNESTAGCYRQIGDLYNTQGQQECLNYYEKAKQIYEYLYGKDCIQCIVVYNNMAGFYEQRKDYTKAEQLVLQALQLKIKYYSADHPDLVQMYSNLATIKLYQKSFKEALVYLERCYTLKKKYFGLQKPETIQVLNQYAKTLAQFGKGGEAIQLCQEAHAACLKAYGPDGQLTLEVMQLLTGIKNVNQQNSVGLSILQKKMKQFHDPREQLSNKVKFSQLVELSESFQKTGMIDEALQCYLEAKQFASSPLFEFEIYRNIAFLYIQNGEVEKGVKQLNKAEEFLNKNKDKDPQFKDFENKFLKPIQDLRTKCLQMLEFQKNNQHKIRF